MVRKNKNLREMTKAKIAEAGINANLCHADLLGIFSRFGNENDMGAEIYKTFLYSDAIFGPDYTISTIQKFAGAPKSYGFSFPAQLGKVYAVKYFTRMLKGIGDEKYLEAIRSYEHNIDSHVRNLAGRTLKELSGSSSLENGLWPKQEELAAAEIKVNSIGDLIRNSPKAKSRDNPCQL